MAITYDKTGNLVIIDNHTNEPYEYTQSVSTEGKHSLEEHDNCTCISENEEDININTLKREANNDKTDEEVFDIIEFVRQYLPCNIL